MCVWLLNLARAFRISAFRIVDGSGVRGTCCYKTGSSVLHSHAYVLEEECKKGASQDDGRGCAFVGEFSKAFVREHELGVCEKLGF